MPVRPNLLERLYLYRLNRGPSALVDHFGAGAFHAMALAVDAGIFDALAEPRTPETLADAVDAHPDGLRPLLEFLATTGYVEHEGDRYRRTASTERWLTDDGDRDANLAPWFLFWRDVVFPFWNDHLETTVREGEPPLTLYEWLDERPELWPTAQRGFRAAATLLADPLADALDLPDDAERLLDLGGGHGYYSADLCERHPDLTATVFDAPEALDVAREEAASRGLGDRMQTRGGDYFSDDLGEDYDAVLLYNVTHAHDGPTLRALFERVRDALAPGGRVAVLDQFAGGGRTSVGRTGVAFVGLTYRVTLGQSLHDADDVTAWLEQAGFRDVDRSSIRAGAPGNVLLQAERA